MKKTLIILFLGCLGLASCEKSQIITPASVGLNKTIQSDSLKAVNEDADPPDLPTGTGRPK